MTNNSEKMEIKVISKETIKPSSPTPPHLQTFETSIVDKILPYGFIQLISFYKPDQNYTKQTSIQLLKESLSQSLTVFYPFAGRIKDNITVDCNDHGVLFVTTRVNSKLSDLLSPQPKFEKFIDFAPPVPPFCPEDKDRSAMIGIQVNEFECGGIAIAFCFCHFIIDAVTVGMFLKFWSKVAMEGCGEASIIPAALMYPQGSDEPMPEGLSSIVEMTLLREGRGTTRRFVFDGEAITALKDRAKSEVVPNPTRVEAVCSFMWSHMMAASEGAWGCKQPSILIMAADLRRRMPETVSSGLSVGNILWKSISHYQNASIGNGAEVEEKQLLGLVREALEKTKHEFVPKLLNNGGYETFRDYLLELTATCSDKSLNPYTFSSWCKTGLNEADFGWGKPIWVSVMGAGIDVEYKNVAILMDGETSENIEAWITLDQREMPILENDQEFLAFASLNPPISSCM